MIKVETFREYSDKKLSNKLNEIIKRGNVIVDIVFAIDSFEESYEEVVKVIYK